MSVIAVTGARGYVGQRLVARLSADGHTVRAFVRPGTPGLPLVPDPRALAEALAGVDAVVHLAAHYVRTARPEDVAPLVASNVALGAALLEGVRQAGVGAVVLADSYLARGGEDGGMPVNLYGATRRAFDALVAWYEDATDLCAVRLVLHDTYGPDDPRGRLVPALLRARTTGTPLPLADAPVDLVHVDDVVAAFVVALRDADALGGRAWAVRSGQVRTPLEVATVLGDVGGRPVPVLPGAYPAPPRPAWLPWPGPTLPGWSPQVSLAQGLARLVAEATS